MVNFRSYIKSDKSNTQVLPIGERFGDDETHVRYHAIKGDWVTTASVEDDKDITIYTLYRENPNSYQVYWQKNTKTPGINHISYSVSGPLTLEDVRKKYPMLKV